MRILTIAASKGGVGKTTITMGMAVEAAAKGQHVVLIDLDPQRSLEGWYGRRSSRKNMVLLEGVKDVAKAVELLRGEKVDWVLIDTPPALLALIEKAIGVADFVLIPVRPGALDLTAIDPVVEMCHQARKKFAFIINGAPSAKSPLVKGAADYLSRDGNVLGTQVVNRSAYMAAPLKGMTAPEIETRGKSKEEMAALWVAVKRIVKKLAG